MLISIKTKRKCCICVQTSMDCSRSLLWKYATRKGGT